jgi:hypothetical protein
MAIHPTQLTLVTQFLTVEKQLWKATYPQCQPPFFVDQNSSGYIDQIDIYSKYVYKIKKYRHIVCGYGEYHEF